jgi:hypothetical protein
VHLHENHRKYFSENRKEYSPFILEKTNWDIREYIKQYFSKNYKLDVSVRPPHKKWAEEGISFIACNTQIQKWKNIFFEYNKSDFLSSKK